MSHFQSDLYSLQPFYISSTILLSGRTSIFTSCSSFTMYHNISRVTSDHNDVAKVINTLHPSPGTFKNNNQILSIEKLSQIIDAIK